jgi:hypothetical protein
MILMTEVNFYFYNESIFSEIIIFDDPLVPVVQPSQAGISRYENIFIDVKNAQNLRLPQVPLGETCFRIMELIS